MPLLQRHGPVLGGALDEWDYFQALRDIARPLGIEDKAEKTAHTERVAMEAARASGFRATVSDGLHYAPQEYLTFSEATYLLGLAVGPRIVADRNGGAR